MKKLLFVAALAACIFASRADGQTQIVTLASGKGVSAYPCGTANANTLFNSVTTSAVYPISYATDIRVTIYSDAGSTATVAIETAPTATGPWFDVTASDPITDPSATGEQWSIPRHEFLRINVSAHAAGNIRACINAWRDATKVY